ncbi:MAG TPA: DUF1697 domain-containing protein [Acidimicrobiales bacterium]|nr:DUF1697 domain-containing protein [Acidimicrobiales bacterium]
MTTYVAMLRGINVSGRNTLTMEDLRALVSAVGGTAVRTYIQSGNAVFVSRRSPSAIVGSLESGLESALGTRVPVLVRTKGELEAIIDTNPFVHRGEDPRFLHVTFMGALPPPDSVTSVQMKPVEADELQLRGREVYLLCPNGYGTTKLTNSFFEKRLGSAATTRNWKTVTKLADLASG